MRSRTRSFVLQGAELALVCAIVLIPVVWMGASSLKHSFEVTRYPPTLWFTPTLQNFRSLFTTVPFFDYFLNSLAVTSGSTVLGLLLAVPAAFAISWHRATWPATLVLFTRMAPGTLFVLPWFVLFTKLGLTGTHTVLILTHTVVTMPLILWVMLLHFDAVPRALFESAFIDGCRPLGCLWRVAVPLVTPGTRARQPARAALPAPGRFPRTGHAARSERQVSQSVSGAARVRQRVTASPEGAAFALVINVAA